MTEVDQRQSAGAQPPQDLLESDATVGLNVFRAGTVIPERTGDDSLAPAERAQHPIPPNSLVWKYWGDNLVNFFTLRTAIIENMWPQLGQGVSDHSQVFSGRGDFLARAQRSNKTITSVVYADPENARKRGIQVRNYHKSIKGSMPNDRTYHGLNAETYYFAHLSFFEMIYASTDWFLPRPMSREEKSQLFEESKLWFSLYGVKADFQPGTYDEYEEYFADIVEHKLVDSKVAQYTIGFAKKRISMPKPNLNPAIGKLWPLVSEAVRLVNIGTLPPVLRERLEVPWSQKDEKNLRRLRFVVRLLYPLYQRLPLKYRYSKYAVEGFLREKIEPRNITLESARAALRESNRA